MQFNWHFIPLLHSRNPRIRRLMFLAAMLREPGASFDQQVQRDPRITYVSYAFIPNAVTLPCRHAVLDKGVLGRHRQSAAQMGHLLGKSLQEKEG